MPSCKNCSHCKVRITLDPGRYGNGNWFNHIFHYRSIRCAKEHWLKNTGEEFRYDIHNQTNPLTKFMELQHSARVNPIWCEDYEGE